uniref:ACB domain-containing protein n=1 Tax=Trypanosoma congolense (strain IL3000) TaxID=1068625 RepID=G0UZX7_TRYCI|nr:conserved hypothetical protein [Trypanosoma congolense IL3000]
MNLAFPEKYYRVAEFFDLKYGDLETTTAFDLGQKLLLYALRQQADHGPCTSAAPFLWQVRERAKHDAWKQLGSMSKFEAMVHFVRPLEESLGGDINLAVKGEEVYGQAATTEPRDASGEHQWDGDLLSHLDPTAENVRFLALEVMRLRRELRRMRPPSGEAVGHVTQARLPVQGVEAPPAAPPGDAVHVCGRVSLIPPRKPLGCVSTKNIVPPARSLAVFATRTALVNARKVTNPHAATNITAERPADGWGEWFGFI